MEPMAIAFTFAALENEIAMLKAELHEANEQLEIVESQRVALAGQLQQERLQLARYQEGVRQLFDTMDRFMELRVKE
jgi:predicted  nucleic acid-binding Zn-ribbon protein